MAAVAMEATGKQEGCGYMHNRDGLFLGTQCTEGLSIAITPSTETVSEDSCGLCICASSVIMLKRLRWDPPGAVATSRAATTSDPPMEMRRCAGRATSAALRMRKIRVSDKSLGGKKYKVDSLVEKRRPLLTAGRLFWFARGLG